ncbi:MAG TPA: Rne/Rng family ribonuclease [Terriglobales bacterium]|nr:Rne/Rng family ribonuclease [Terriglobales bacterium]
MSKELYVTSTPHETKLAVVEDDQLVEVFFERENEYTLAGSIYKGKVTRVLPGMQSAFVEIGLERDAFLYVTDFLEEVEEDDSEPTKQTTEGEATERPERTERSERPERNDRERSGRDRGGRHRRNRHSSQQQQAGNAAPPVEGGFTIEHDSTGGFESDTNRQSDAEIEPLEAAAIETSENQPEIESESRGPRRWRGRRGRRRGRGVPEAKFAQPESGQSDSSPIEAAEVLPEFSGDFTGAGDEEDDSQTATLGAVNDTTSEVSEGAASAAHDEEHMAGGRDGRPREGDNRPRQNDDRGREGRKRFERGRQDRTSGRELPPREERGREERPRSPIVLPGESLAKFGRKVEDSAQTTASTPAPAEGLTRLPRPSTEYTAPTGLMGAGVLAGETLAKYRNRPAQQEAGSAERPVEDRQETRHAEVSASAAPAKEIVESFEQEVKEAPPEASAVVVQTAAPATELEEAAEVAPEAGRDAVSQSQESKLEDRSKSEHKFGHGVVEEEEIEEEENDVAQFSEELDEGEFEELEEETLEHREDDVIAAGEGLAEAFARSRVEEPSETYMVQDEEDEEPTDDAETAELSEDGEAVELEAEGGYGEDSYGEEEPGDEEPEADPDDPNYAGRAEMRGASGTAGFQQRQERGRGERRGGGKDRDRGRRGGRPIRRGGPRRNIPRGPMPQIGELLKEGQEILVQIAKEPMAKKGARITSHIALPGRFLVFMPTVSHTGVSRKIGSDEERQRLKRILLSEKGQSNGGFIVRTAAAGASEEDLRADIRFLINLWSEIKQRAESSKGPTLIYHDLNLVERILRDQVTANFSHIWVDTEQEYERILRFASRFQPSLVKRVKLYTKDTPLFEQFNIQEEINKALKSKVWLKSGGYIVINQTEALVAIDINTGKYVGKTGRLEDTIVKTNLDAIKEIVRQIRLRDLGGIIIIDFIDMDERKNRQKVMQALEAELKNDRSPSKVLQFNDFGLVAITRKRVKQSLERTLSTPCVYCTGTGMIKSVATVCNEIYVEMRKMNRHLEGGQVMLRVNPEVAKALKENQGRWLVEMEELTGKSIIVKSDPAQHQEQFDIQ